MRYYTDKFPSPNLGLSLKLEAKGAKNIVIAEKISVP